MKRTHSLAWLVAVWSAGLLSAAAAWNAHQPVAVIPSEPMSIVPSAAAPAEVEWIAIKPVTIVGHPPTPKPYATPEALGNCPEGKVLEQGSGQVRICA